MTEQTKTVVTIGVAPGDESTAYTLTLPDGRSVKVDESQPEYHALAGIVDGAFGNYQAAAHAAGLDIVGGILEVLEARDTVSQLTLNRLSPDDITNLYNTYVGPAIDLIEAELS